MLLILFTYKRERKRKYTSSQHKDWQRRGSQSSTLTAMKYHRSIYFRHLKWVCKSSISVLVEKYTRCWSVMTIDDDLESLLLKQLVLIEGSWPGKETTNLYWSKCIQRWRVYHNTGQRSKIILELTGEREICIVHDLSQPTKTSYQSVFLSFILSFGSLRLHCHSCSALFSQDLIYLSQGD